MNLMMSENSKQTTTTPTNHNNEVMKNVKLILDEGQLCDVVLIASTDGKRIPTHRLILSANSCYFKTMFTVAMKEAMEKEIKINDIDGETLQSLVTYCYNGDLNLREDNAEKILSAAHLMRFISVVDKCAEYLKTQLCSTNCLGIKFISEQFNCPELHEHAHNYVCENFYQVTKSEEFLQLSVDQLSILLSDDDLNVELEEDIFRCLKMWVQHDKVNRKMNILQLLPKVRLAFLSPEFMAEHVKPLCESNGCLELYEESVQSKSVFVASIKPRSLSGGYLLAYNNNGQFEKYRPILKQWSLMEEMTLEESNFGVVVRNENLVAVGGWLNNACVNSVKCWDVKLKIWMNLSPLNTARYNVGLAVFGESLYVVGGYTENGWDNHVYRLESISGSWQCVSPMPIPLTNIKVAVYDDCIYVVGNNYKIEHLLKYKPNTDEWNDLDVTTSTLRSLVEVNYDLYAIRSREIQRYNMITNSWSMCTNNCPDIERACAFNNRLLVVAIENNKLHLKEYKILDNIWIDLAPLNMTDISRFIYIPLSIISSP